MALNELKIIVVDGGKLGDYKEVLTNRERQKKASAKGEDDFKNSKLYKALHASEEIRNKIAKNTNQGVMYSLQAGVNLATQVARQTANYYITDIGRSHGDSNYQAQINRTIELVGDYGGLFTGTLNGIVAGSSAGPFGMVIGAILGLASSSIGLGFKNAGREREYQHQLFKENTSQAYNLARANYSAFTGRLR